MKVKQLLKSLSTVKAGIASKDVIESMTYFYFSGTHVISYNDFVSISSPLKTDFITFVKAADLYKVIDKLGKKEDLDVAFKFEGTALKMKAGNVLTSFATIEDKDVVKRIQSIQESLVTKHILSLPDEFMHNLNLCSYVASSNESDQNLTCVHVKGKQMVSTDNQRIAMAPISKPMPELLIRAKEVRALTQTKPNKFMTTEESAWIHFLSSETGSVFSIKKMKGEYPEMSQHAKFSGKVVDLPETLFDSLDLASTFSDQGVDSVQVKISQDLCTVSSSSETGSILIRNAVKYKGEEVQFKINPEFLRDMMKHSTKITVAADRAKLESEEFTMVTALVV